MAYNYRVLPMQAEANREAAAVIYVVDVSDRERMYNREPKTLLILANKQDVHGGISIAELIEKQAMRR
ncbi:hypothetical protein BG003_000339 [Podila horticola]|nr:hypothetical protein BG003_000339 [Podila horticola]